MGGEYRTRAELESLYPNEWVYLNRPTSAGRSLAVTGGEVVFHSPDRGEFLRRVFDFPEVVEGAVLFTGPPILDEVPEVAPAAS